MFSICKKDEEEISKNQEGFYSPYYIKTSDNVIIDGASLTDEVILYLVESEIEEYLKQDKNKERGYSLENSLELGEVLGANYVPSYPLVISLLELLSKYPSIMFLILDVVKSLNGMPLLEEASNILRYLKETKGDFSPNTNEEIINTLEQLELNRILRERQDKDTFIR